MRRHDRQARLAEVGAAGQTRIERASVALAEEGFAGDVAVRYLAGAGVGALRVTEASLAEVARSVDPAIDVRTDAAVGSPRVASGADAGPALPLRDPVARELARGALVALAHLRRALGGTS